MKKVRKDSIPENKLKKILQKTVKNGECMEWTGNYFKRYGSRKYKNDHLWGYPYMYYLNKVWRGNRLVMFLVHGNIPDGTNVLHSCDNMKCVNPKHLYFGTSKQNYLDMIERKRIKIVVGENNPNSKLKEKDILKIRDLYKEGKSYKELAEMFMVTTSNIGMIIRKKQWIHVKEVLK